MKPCPDKAMLVQALFDNELDAVNAAAAEAHLKSCEGCDAEFQRLQALREAVTAPGVAHAAPDALRARIMSGLAAEAAPPKPQSRRAPTRVIAGGLGAALAACLVVMVGVPQVTESGMERQLVAGHVRSLLANHLVDIVTSNQHVVRPWFNGKVDVAPPAPELAPQGFPLVGGRLDYIDGRVTPALVYRRRAHTVNLFVLPAEGRLLNIGRATHRDGYSLVEWTEGGLRYAAVSDVEMAELKQFRDTFIAQTAADK